MRKLIVLQVFLVVIALFITGWIFFKERPQAEVNHQLSEELNQVKQENQKLQQVVAPNADQIMKAHLFLKQGRDLFHKQQYNDAIAQYEQALKIQPDDPYVLGLEGYALLRAGRVAESIDTNKKVLQLDPEDAFGYLNLAKSYCAAKQYTQAQAVLTADLPSDIAADVKNFVAIDGEFRRLCKPILANVERPSQVEPMSRQ
jgi:Flp pilus assembly protein TadD